MIGVNVAGMTYDSLEVLAGFHESEKLGYPLLKDNGAEHVIAFGVLNDDYEEGHRAYGIPHPGILLIAPSGQILAKYALPGYRKRPPFEELYEHVAASLP